MIPRPVRRSLIAVVVVAGLVALALWISQEMTLQHLVAREQQWRLLLREYPVRTVGFGVALYTATSLVPGTSGKSIAAGWLLGMVKGLFVVMVGLVTAALISFLIGRFLLRDVIQTRLPGGGRLLNSLMSDNPGWRLFTLRMAHTPYTLMNYTAAVSRVDPVTFIWSTALGLLPASALLTWFGAGLPDLQEVADRGVWGLADFPLIAAFVLMALLPWAVRAVAERTMAPQSPGRSTEQESEPSKVSE